MENSEKNISRADDYLLGRMSEEERSIFEKELLYNEQLRNILETQTQIHKAILLSRRSEMKSELKQIHKNLYEAPVKKPNKHIWTTVVALIFLSVFAWYFLNPSKVSNEELFAANYNAFEHTTNLRGNDNNSDFKKIYTLYESKEYQKTINSIRSTKNAELINNEIKLMLGISYLETQDYAKAHNILDEIINNNDPFYSDHAKWYKSLVFLKQNDEASTRIQLEALIKDPNADHFEDAKEILKILK